MIHRSLFLISLIFIGFFGEGPVLSGKQVMAEPLKDSLSDALTSYLKKHGTGAHVAVQDLSQSAPLFEFHSDSAVKPASTLKLVTSVVALRQLGPESTFNTEVWGDRTALADGLLKKFAIRGGGDPDFTIESLWMIVRRLKKLGVKKIDEIVLDDSLYAPAPKPSGQRAYEAAGSALSFNFNSIAIEVCPSQVSKVAIISPDPYEVPVQIRGKVMTVHGESANVNLDEVNSGDASAANLEYRISGTIGDSAPCRAIYRSITHPTGFLGRTLIGLLSQNGIQVPAAFRVDVLPKNLTLLFEWHSQPLDEIVRGLNHYSNNFIAEQLLNAIGNKNPKSWSRAEGLTALSSYLLSLGLDPKEFYIQDASGLSHENRISARGLLRVITDGFRDPRIGPEFIASLSVGNRTGTLKDRDLGSDRDIVRAKTGSLNGVSSLAGLLQIRGGRSYAFVVIGNRKLSMGEEHRFQEEIVGLIIKYAQSS